MTKQVQQWAHDNGVHYCYQIPFYPEASNLVEHGDGLLKVPWWCHQERGAVLSITVSTYLTIIGCFILSS